MTSHNATPSRQPAVLPQASRSDVATCCECYFFSTEMPPEPMFSCTPFGSRFCS